MPHNKRTLTGVLGGLLGLVALSAVAGLLVTATVTPAIAVTGLAGSQALNLFEELPNDLQVDTPMEPTTIWATDSDGKKIKLASFYDQNRIPVTYDQVAPIFYDAILSSEDKSYYEHGGINVASTASAVLDYVKGTSSRGASTISQQYVKNVLIQRCEQEVQPTDEDYQKQLEECFTTVTNAQGTDGIQRKLQEMRYAIQIEKDYSKNDILLGYLNLSNFGGTTYGIEAAAKRYFGVSAKKLNLNQAATLAGMVQNPNRFRIDRPEGSWTDKDGNARNSEEDGYADALLRRNYVLKRMLDDGKITKEQYDTTHAEPITPKITTTTQGCATAKSNAYFCQYVKTIIESDPAFGEDNATRRQTLKRGGLDIYTTLDVDLQKTAVESMKDRVVSSIDGMKFGAATVSVEPSTGRVLSMTQNTKFDESSKPKKGSTSLVYASDYDHGGSGGFNVGSTYKLFTLLDWLENGKSVNAVLDGRLKTFSPFMICGNSTPNKTQIGNAGGNRGYVGTVREFTEKSLNTGFLAMAQQLDICEINQMADRLGVTLGSGKKVTAQNFPGDVIGSKNIAPLAMAGAFATVANKGVYCTPQAIDKIVKPDGTEMELPESSCEQVISPEVAATAAYTLRGVMNWTGSGARVGDGVPVFGKTGTHEQSQTMMVESSTEVTTAVWVGNVSGEARLSAHSSHGTALNYLRFYLARDIQREANHIYGGHDFPAPDKNLTRRVYAQLPDVVGMSLSDATAKLEDAGFFVSDGGEVDSPVEAGKVGSQSPGPGRVAAGSTVTLGISNGQGAVVPNVVGRPANQAQGAFAGAGLHNVNWDGSCSAPGATVKSVNPGEGETVNRDTVITVVCEVPKPGPGDGEGPGNGDGNGNGNGNGSGNGGHGG